MPPLLPGTGLGDGMYGALELPRVLAGEGRERG